MKSRGLLYFLALSISLFACYSTKVIHNDSTEVPTVKPSVNFIQNDEMDLMSVVEKAEEVGKIVYVSFGASWCLPCQLMEEEVYNQKEVYSFFNENFINYKIDVDKANGGNLKYLYEVESLPTILFLNSKGNIIVRNNGTAMSSKLLRLAKEALARKS